jgi:hypothetical protein
MSDGEIKLVPDLPIWERRLGQQLPRPSPELTLHAGGLLDVEDGPSRAGRMLDAARAAGGADDGTPKLGGA